MNLHDGYFVQKCEKIESLNSIKLQVCNLIRKEFNIECDDNERVLNQFHEFVNNMNEADFNEKRILLIKKINESINFKELIFDSFKDTILGLLGPDLLVQKNCNIVIQRPNDANPSELHRDAPGNSSYEIVLWIPLVNCFKTKAMYLVDYKSTLELYDVLEKNLDWELFESESIKKSSLIPVNFGEALFFSTSILHGSHINQESETRISLNIRFKNIFSPSGLKNQLQFFEKFLISDLVEIGSNLELKKLTSQSVRHDN
jgi:sporadic carbohydrate cluster 2OG-Fe(II) oxygenase